MFSVSFCEEDLSVTERNNKIPVFILGLRRLEPSSHSRVYGNFSRDFPILSIHHSFSSIAQTICHVATIRHFLFVRNLL